MAEYATIKELVIDCYASEGGVPSYEKLTALVRKHFPASKWKKTHYAWYKSKIKQGEIEVQGEESSHFFSEQESDDAVDTTIELGVSVERDLQAYFIHNVAQIEPGLQLAQEGAEFVTDAGRIDLLCRTESGDCVVIELKAGKAKDAALGQLLGYIGCLAGESSRSDKIRGILIASDFEQRVIYAARSLPNIKLIRYQLSFSLSSVD